MPCRSIREAPSKRVDTLIAHGRLRSSIQRMATIYHQQEEPTKVFLRIEGVYYQAIVQGEAITWIVLRQFTQTVSSFWHI